MNNAFFNRVTGGYTGKAKSCIEAWVPTVSIRRHVKCLEGI
jgi:hypothetical protein